MILPLSKTSKGYLTVLAAWICLAFLIPLVSSSATDRLRDLTTPQTPITKHDHLIDSVDQLNTRKLVKLVIGRIKEDRNFLSSMVNFFEYCIQLWGQLTGSKLKTIEDVFWGPEEDKTTDAGEDQGTTLWLTTKDVGVVKRLGENGKDSDGGTIPKYNIASSVKHNENGAVESTVEGLREAGYTDTGHAKTLGEAGEAAYHVGASVRAKAITSGNIDTGVRAKAKRFKNKITTEKPDGDTASLSGLLQSFELVKPGFVDSNTEMTSEEVDQTINETLEPERVDSSPEDMAAQEEAWHSHISDSSSRNSEAVTAESKSSSVKETVSLSTSDVRLRVRRKRHHSIVTSLQENSADMDSQDVQVDDIKTQAKENNERNVGEADQEQHNDKPPVSPGVALPVEIVPKDTSAKPESDKKDENENQEREESLKVLEGTMDHISDTQRPRPELPVDVSFNILTAKETLQNGGISVSGVAEKHSPSKVFNYEIREYVNGADNDFEDFGPELLTFRKRRSSEVKKKQRHRQSFKNGFRMVDGGGRRSRRVVGDRNAKLHAASIQVRSVNQAKPASNHTSMVDGDASFLLLVKHNHHDSPGGDNTGESYDIHDQSRDGGKSSRHVPGVGHPGMVHGSDNGEDGMKKTTDTADGPREEPGPLIQHVAKPNLLRSHRKGNPAFAFNPAHKKHPRIDHSGAAVIVFLTAGLILFVVILLVVTAARSDNEGAVRSDSNQALYVNYPHY